MFSLTYSPSYNLTPPISRVLIGEHLIFCSWRHQRAVTRLENVRQLNIKRGQKLGFQLAHRQLLKQDMYRDAFRTLSNNYDAAFFRSSCPKLCCKKSVLRNFAKITGKHLCQSFFFTKVPGLRPQA